jgi:hypothetical protein
MRVYTFTVCLSHSSGVRPEDDPFLSIERLANPRVWSCNRLPWRPAQSPKSSILTSKVRHAAPPATPPLQGRHQPAACGGARRRRRSLQVAGARRCQSAVPCCQRQRGQLSPLSGRAEVLRLALAAAGVEFEFEAVHRTPDSWGAAKKDLDSYHFGQVPRQVVCIWRHWHCQWWHCMSLSAEGHGPGHAVQCSSNNDATRWPPPATHLPGPPAPPGTCAPALLAGRFIDDEVDMCQSEAILRHIGRKHGLYGASLAEQARVDEVGWASCTAASSALARCQLGAHSMMPCGSCGMKPKQPLRCR